MFVEIAPSEKFQIEHRQSGLMNWLMDQSASLARWQAERPQGEKLLSVSLLNASGFLRTLSLVSSKITNWTLLPFEISDSNCKDVSQIL